MKANMMMYGRYGGDIGEVYHREIWGRYSGDVGRSERDFGEMWAWHVKANMMMESAGKVLMDGDHSLIGSEAGSGSATEAHAACTITERTR